MPNFLSRFFWRRLMARANSRENDPVWRVGGAAPVQSAAGEPIAGFLHPADGGTPVPEDRDRTDDCAFAWRFFAGLRGRTVTIVTRSDGRFALWLAQEVLPTEDLTIIVTAGARHEAVVRLFEEQGRGPGVVPVATFASLRLGRTRKVDIRAAGDIDAAMADVPVSDALWIDAFPQPGALPRFDLERIRDRAMIRWDFSATSRPAVADLSGRAARGGLFFDGRLTSPSRIVLRAHASVRRTY